MSKRISTAFANFLADGGSWAAGLSGGRIKVYSGSQPASANDAPTGTLLAVFTKDGGNYTAGVQATATITLSGSAGSVSSVTVGGMKLMESSISYTTDLTTTAGLLAAEINLRKLAHGFTATSSGAIVTLLARKNSGDNLNGMTVAVTAATLTATINGGSSTTLGGAGATAGVDAVNGLSFLAATGGLLKKASENWQALGLVDGIAGWMRFEGSGNDDQSSDAITQKFIRFDCSIGTTGADINVTNANVATGATQTFGKFELQVPVIQQ